MSAPDQSNLNAMSPPRDTKNQSVLDAELPTSHTSDASVVETYQHVWRMVQQGVSEFFMAVEEDDGDSQQQLSILSEVRGLLCCRSDVAESVETS
jgi:hypothetical protein